LRIDTDAGQQLIALRHGGLKLALVVFDAAAVRTENARVTPTKRVTIDFDPRVLYAPRLRAEETGRALSDLVDEAVWAALAEDVEDLAALAERREEPDVSFAAVVRGLRRRGALS
jgi:hypothetical protein